LLAVRMIRMCKTSEPKTARVILFLSDMDEPRLD
jgi:hypothetical protein